MSAERRCPSCGALASDEAKWCGQCYASLSASHDEGPQRSGERTGVPAAAPDIVRGGEPTWSCPVCGRDNAMELNECAVCGTPFARLFQEPERRPEIAPRDAALWSLVFPGIGHWRCGRTLDGVARGVMFAWVFGALLVLLLSRAGKGGLGVTFPMFGLFLAASVALYALSAVDAYRIAGGDAPLVSTRTLLWGSVTVLVLSVVLASLVMLPAVRGR